MLTTPNMGLKEWDLAGDFFSFAELKDNWDKVDQHDHTATKGLQIPTDGIANLAITGPKIASGSIDRTKFVGSKLDSTAVAPTMATVVASSNLTMTSTFTDIAGTSLVITPTVASTIFIVGTFELNMATAAGLATQEVDGALNVDGVNQTRIARFFNANTAGGTAQTFTVTVSQSWVLSLTAAAHTIKLQARAQGAFTSSSAVANSTAWSYMLFAS
jgi:hypothetical protein